MERSYKREAHTQLSWENEGLINMYSPLQCIVLPLGTLRVVCPCLWSRGPATAETLRQLRSRESHIDLMDGLETGSPYFHLHSPGLVLSRGRSLRCSSSPLSESALICSSFLSKKIYTVLFRVAHVLPRQRTLWSFSVDFMNFSLQTVFTCLGIWLHLILKN